MSYASHNFADGNIHKVIEIKDDKVGIIAKERFPKVLYFTASWCGPCKRIQPVYENLAKIHTMTEFFKIDVDKNPTLAEKFSIQSMPTFFFFKSTTESRKFSGADAAELERNVKWLMS